MFFAYLLTFLSDELLVWLFVWMEVQIASASQDPIISCLIYAMRQKKGTNFLLVCFLYSTETGEFFSMH